MSIVRKLRRSLRPAVLVLMLASAAALAQPVRQAPPAKEAPQAREAPSPAAHGPGVLSMLPPDATTDHVIAVSGETLAYTATAGTLMLFDQDGERLGALFYTAYRLKGAEARMRPVTFVFNGGPGAASVYLHLGLVGPQVIDFSPQAGGAPARLVDNPDTWLKFTDLVLIDPIGSGWSRAAKAGKTHDFWSVRADAQILAKAIALYVARNGRSESPKYLLGESYGGYRAVKVASALQREQGILVSGIVMVSPFLDGALQFRGSRYALGAALLLPSLAAAELDRNGRFTPEALAAAEHFAMTDYLVTLAGKPPEGEAAKTFYARVAKLTGASVDAVRRARGFVRNTLKRKDSGQVGSAYDATFLVPDPFPESESAEGGDPILDGYVQALGGIFVGYARDQLGFKTDMTYTMLNREASSRWDWGDHSGRAQANASHDLRELLALDPGLRIFIAHGRSDLVTPYSVSRYVLDHLPALGARDRTQLKVYRGGHMLYLDPGPRAALTADAGAFYHRREP